MFFFYFLPQFRPQLTLFVGCQPPPHPWQGGQFVSKFTVIKFNVNIHTLKMVPRFHFIAVLCPFVRTISIPLPLYLFNAFIFLSYHSLHPYIFSLSTSLSLLHTLWTFLLHWSIFKPFYSASSLFPFGLDFFWSYFFRLCSKSSFFGWNRLA